MDVPVLVGDRVVLRGVRPEDVTARQAHGYHAEIERNYGHAGETRPMRDDEAQDWYDRYALLDPTHLHWVIEIDGELAGVAFLHSIDERDHKARFAIGMFAPEFIGKGIGSEATRLILAHAFGPVGLHRVDLRVLAFNDAAITSYRRCGFVEEGRERESCFLGGVWHDDVIMGVLATEFIA